MVDDSGGVEVTAGRTLSGVTRTTLTVLALGALLAGCSGNAPATRSPAGASTAPSPPASPTPSPEPSYRPAVIGEPFDVGGWTVTVTGQRCGRTADLITGGTDAHVVESDYVCIISVTGVNTGPSPARLEQGSDSAPGPLDAVGFDGRNQRFTGTSWAQAPTNPGATVTQQLMFGVAADVRLSRLAIGNVLVTLR